MKYIELNNSKSFCKKAFLRPIVVLLFLAFTFKCYPQTATLGTITANPGENIEIPLNFYGMSNLGSLTLFIGFDASIMTFNGIANVIPEGAGTFTYLPPNTSIVGLSWIASGFSGVDFPNGKYLDLKFTFLGGAGGLTFEPNCEISDWDGNILTINYIDGSIVSPSITFNIKVMLEGAYESGSGGVMDTHIATDGLLPQNHPFSPGLPYYGNSNPPWYYAGTENISESIPNSVDWVLVELRDAATLADATSSSIIAQKACMLLSDGSVFDIDASGDPTFYTSINYGAFVVIYHRNHLGIISSVPVSGFGNSYFYDFSTGANNVAGGDNAYVEVESGIWAMMAGDINGDKTIDALDKSLGWVSDAAAFGYLGSDINLDAQVNNTDKNDFIIQNLNSNSGIPD